MLSDGNNVKQYAVFLKTILKIRQSELMKPQEHLMCLINFQNILKCVNELTSLFDVY